MAETQAVGIHSVLRAVANPQIEVETYHNYMNQIGSHLAGVELHGEHAPRSSFHVICGVEDFDHIGHKVIQTLRGLGHIAHFSCFWTEHRVLAQAPLLDWAPINRAYDEQLTEPSYHLVVVASAVGSVTPIECMLLRIFSEDKRPDYKSITIASPFILNTAISELKRKLAPCFDGQFIRCGLETNRKLWPDGSPNPGLGMSGAARVGLGDNAHLRRYIPSHIRTLISTPRDPGPEGSMGPGPKRGPTRDGGEEIDASTLRKHGYLTDFAAPYYLRDADYGYADLEAEVFDIADNLTFPRLTGRKFTRSTETPYENIDDIQSNEAENDDVGPKDDREFRM